MNNQQESQIFNKQVLNDPMTKKYMANCKESNECLKLPESKFSI